MHIGFIIENWQDTEPKKSSTLLIMQECLMRGHKVSVLYPENLTVRNNIVHGFAKTIKSMEKVPDKVDLLFKRITFDEAMIPLHGFDCIFLRKDPPIDPLMLNFLDSVKNETVVLNDIDGLRKANNKLYTTTFHDPNNDFLPVTHVSKNKDYLMRMIEESDQEKMILKPLDESGGRGVIILEKNARSSIKSLLDFYISGKGKEHYVIIQEFLEGAEEGDVRVLMLNGQFLGAYNRKPADGELRANIEQGGTPHKYVMTEAQMSVCRKVGPKLASDGLFFVGLDMIGEKVLEINVCNPGGISNINALNKVKLQRAVVDGIEEKVNERQERRAELEHLFNRLNALRNA